MAALIQFQQKYLLEISEESSQERKRARLADAYLLPDHRITVPETRHQCIGQINVYDPVAHIPWKLQNSDLPEPSSTSRDIGKDKSFLVSKSILIERPAEDGLGTLRMLPPELRLAIYEYVLDYKFDVQLSQHHFNGYKEEAVEPNSLMLTSRAIRNEAHATFVAQPSDSSLNILITERGWCSNVHPDRLRHPGHNTFYDLLGYFRSVRLEILAPDPEDPAQVLKLRRNCIVLGACLWTGRWITTIWPDVVFIDTPTRSWGHLITGEYLLNTLSHSIKPIYSFSPDWHIEMSYLSLVLDAFRKTFMVSRTNFTFPANFTARLQTTTDKNGFDKIIYFMTCGLSQSPGSLEHSFKMVAATPIKRDPHSDLEVALESLPGPTAGVLRGEILKHPKVYQYWRLFPLNYQW